MLTLWTRSGGVPPHPTHPRGQALETRLLDQVRWCPSSPHPSQRTGSGGSSSGPGQVVSLLTPPILEDRLWRLAFWTRSGGVPPHPTHTRGQALEAHLLDQVRWCPFSPHPSQKTGSGASLSELGQVVSLLTQPMPQDRLWSLTFWTRSGGVPPHPTHTRGQALEAHLLEQVR
jgi:hypothetical protein